MRVKLSPDAIDRLKDITSRYGRETAKKITTSAKGLSQNPAKGVSVEKMLGIESPYMREKTSSKECSALV